MTPARSRALHSRALPPCVQPAAAQAAKQKAAAESAAQARADGERAAAWEKALQHAGGAKVRDSEKLLKKTVKRKEAQKRKSAAAWAERTAEVARSKAERQQTRRINLANRARRHKGLPPLELPAAKAAAGATASAAGEPEKHTRKERKEFATKLAKKKEAAEAQKPAKAKGGGARKHGDGSKRPRVEQ